MKSKLFITVVLALMPTLFFAQAFDKFESDSNIISCIVGKKTFSILGSVKTQEADKKQQKLIKKIDNVSAYFTDNVQSGGDMKATAENYIKTSGLEELMRIKDKGVNAKIMVKSGASQTRISEILVFVDSFEKEQNTALVFIKGDFDLDEISDLIGKIVPKATDKPIDDKLGAVNEALKLSVSPNPVSDTFFINTDQPAEIKIYDTTGRLVKSQSYGKEGVSVSGLNPATYIVEINIGSKKQTERIIVK